jgi:uncharacterized protein (TIGR02266 family)
VSHEVDDDAATDAVQASADSSDSRRQSPRAGVVLKLQYRNAGHLLVSYCTNLSRGGLFVPSSEPLPAGTEITLELAIPGQSAPAKIAAEVRWVRHFDAAEGPAGMGLSFEAVDKLLGDRIDGIVSQFAPLRIELVGHRPSAWTHIGALVRSLVTCETRERVIDPRKADALAEADLVIVDLDHGDASEGVELLRALKTLAVPPPAIALCAEKDAALRSRVTRVARVVLTPIDPAELRTCVLETVTQVRAV